MFKKFNTQMAVGFLTMTFVTNVYGAAATSASSSAAGTGAHQLPVDPNTIAGRVLPRIAPASVPAAAPPPLATGSGSGSTGSCVSVLGSPREGLARVIHHIDEERLVFPLLSKDGHVEEEAYLPRRVPSRVFSFFVTPEITAEIQRHPLTRNFPADITHLIGQYVNYVVCGSDHSGVWILDPSSLQPQGPAIYERTSNMGQFYVTSVGPELYVCDGPSLHIMNPLTGERRPKMALFPLTQPLYIEDSVLIDSYLYLRAVSLKRLSVRSPWNIRETVLMDTTTRTLNPRGFWPWEPRMLEVGSHARALTRDHVSGITTVYFHHRLEPSETSSAAPVDCLAIGNLKTGHLIDNIEIPKTVFKSPISLRSLALVGKSVFVTAGPGVVAKTDLTTPPITIRTHFTPTLLVPLKDKIFCLNEDESTVMACIHGTDNSVNKIPLGEHPQYLAHSNTHLFVLHDGDQLSVIDADMGINAIQIPLPTQPYSGVAHWIDHSLAIWPKDIGGKVIRIHKGRLEKKLHALRTASAGSGSGGSAGLAAPPK